MKKNELPFGKKVNCNIIFKNIINIFYKLDEDIIYFILFYKFA